MSDRSERDEKPEAVRRYEFGKSTRRTFISRLGMAGLLATTARVTTALGQSSVKEESALAESKDAIPSTVTVNGKTHYLRIDPRTTLSYSRRGNSYLTGSKMGCDHRHC